MTIKEANEIVSLVCDQLCIMPWEYAEEGLEVQCESCPLVEMLLKKMLLKKARKNK